MTLESRDVKTIAELIKELSTEIDLHYENDDLHAVEPTMTVLAKGADILARKGSKLPEAYIHITKRYRHAVEVAND